MDPSRTRIALKISMEVVVEGFRVAASSRNQEGLRVRGMHVYAQLSDAARRLLTCLLHAATVGYRTITG
jgi:hypothetical protein